MFKQKNRLQLYVLTHIPVILIILGALAVSGEALFENFRFITATNELSTVINAMRSYAKEQRTLSFNPGEDILGNMINLAQIPASAHTNPWGGDVRAIAVANMEMRIESDVPSRDCRRIALYLLGRKPVELGLLSMEAQSSREAAWMPIYPVPDIGAGAAAQNSCGNANDSHLALVFKIRD